MNSLRHGFILFLLLMIFFKILPTASAQTLYIDPANGDDRNSGTSPNTPLKNQIPSRWMDNNHLIQLRLSDPQRQATDIRAAPLPAPVPAKPHMERILLGSKILIGWEAFTETIWQAPVQWQQNWRLNGLTVDGTWYQEGCAPDFLDNGQYYMFNNRLFINVAAGNPENENKTVTVHAYDYQSESPYTFDVSGWTSSAPTVWQDVFPSEPIHLFVDETLSDQNWWYGKQACQETEIGKDGYLYLKDPDGNPDDLAKTTVAVVDTGGWSAAAGDFNGDGLPDAVHANGSAQIYINYGAAEFSPTPDQILHSPHGESRFGYYLALAGDVNNDGFDDLLVAMDFGAGKVYLYFGSKSGLNDTSYQALTAPGNYPAYSYGHGIAGHGNINGDDYSDVLVIGGDDSEAYLCVYLGSDAGIAVDPIILLLSGGAVSGGSVCFAGDMNKDGYDEVAVSVPGVTSGMEILVYRGSADAALDKPQVLQITAKTQSTDYCQVAPAGDINSDGYADLMVGNEWAGGTSGAREGKAYLFLGSGSGPRNQPDIEIANPRPEQNVRFGKMVAGIGDFDRDGRDDIAVGCPYSQNGNGFVAIYSGSAKGPVTTPTQILDGAGFFGWSLSTAGDLKGNGQPYLIAGEEFGAAYLYAMPCDTIYYRDVDNDGYGDKNQTTMACIRPTGYSDRDSDCDDTKEAINPGAEENCNGVDDNCNDEVDEGCLPPAADAGADREMVEGGLVMLDGSASSPAEASRPITVYAWTQIDGPNVVLSGGDTAGPSFMTPAVGPDGAVLVFQLKVQDAIGFSNTDQVAITIRDNGITGFPEDVLTFMSATGHPVGIKIHGNASLLKIISVDPAGLPDTDHMPGNMTYGVFDLTLRVLNPGSRVDVTFYFPSQAEADQVWCHYNAVDGWSNSSELSAFDADRKSITIHLTDGAAGDDDQTANGIIDNVSGLGVFALEPSGNDTDSGDGGGGGGGCFISTMEGAADCTPSQ